jgi:hypothetical protein
VRRNNNLSTKDASLVRRKHFLNRAKPYRHDVRPIWREKTIGNVLLVPTKESSKRLAARLQRWPTPCNVRTIRLQIYDLVKVVRSPSVHFRLSSKAHLISIEITSKTVTPSRPPECTPSILQQLCSQACSQSTCSRNALIRIDNATQQQRQTSQPIFRGCRPLRRI